MLSRLKKNIKATTLGKYIIVPIYRIIVGMINYERLIQLLMIFLDSHKMYKVSIFFAKCHIFIPGYYVYFKKSRDYYSHASAATFFAKQLGATPSRMRENRRESAIKDA